MPTHRRAVAPRQPQIQRRSDRYAVQLPGAAPKPIPIRVHRPSRAGDLPGDGRLDADRQRCRMPDDHNSRRTDEQFARAGVEFRAQAAEASVRQL